MGLSVGIYGATQALFQVPFGLWSDRFGRRRVIVAGLVIFVAGSVIAAEAETALWLVVGRALQGAGAIASAVVAMMADVTRDHVRTRAMATLGFAVGLSLSLGLVLGPGLASKFGVPGLFWATAVLSLLAAAYMLAFIPRPPTVSHHEELEWTSDQLGDVLHARALVRLDLGALLLHTMVTALFVAVPIYMAEVLETDRHGLVYAFIMPIALVLMGFSSVWADRHGRLREVILAGAVCLAGAGAALALVADSLPGIVAICALTIFGVALAAPAQPAFVTRLASPRARGTASGLFHMCQFGGSFLGGTLGGVLIESPAALGWGIAGGGLLWLFSNAGLPRLDPAKGQVSMAGSSRPGGGELQ